MADDNIGHLNLTLSRADGITICMPDGRSIRVTTDQPEQINLWIQAPRDIRIMRDKALEKELLRISAEAADQ